MALLHDAALSEPSRLFNAASGEVDRKRAGYQARDARVSSA
jgi:hypothetical protein